MKNRLKKTRIQNFTIDTPNKYWAVIFGYHVHKGVIGLIFMPLGFFAAFSNFSFGALLFMIGLGIVVMDTIGHIHTNWHKRVVFIEKHKGLTYKQGGYKKMEVKV